MEDMVAARVDPDAFTDFKVIYAYNTPGVTIYITNILLSLKPVNLVKSETIVHKEYAILIENSNHVIPFSIFLQNISP